MGVLLHIMETWNADLNLRCGVDIVVHQSIWLSEVIITDILDLDHLPIMISILDPVRTKEALDPIEKLTDWELFKASPLNS